MIKSRVVAVLLLVVAMASGTTPAEAQASAPVEVGQAYKVLIGMAAVRFKILDIGKGGLVKVQAAEDAPMLGIPNGSLWWLNLNQALLVQASTIVGR